MYAFNTGRLDTMIIYLFIKIVSPTAYIVIKFNKVL